MPTRRLLPPITAALQTRTVHTRTYSGTLGNTYDIPDYDAGPLVANGWIDCGLSGNTSQRPTGTGISVPPLFPGQLYIDLEANVVARWDGKNWRNVLTGASV
jgi:hypothetical protein